MADGDEVAIGHSRAKVIATPGHTTGHIAYYFPEDEVVFVEVRGRGTGTHGGAAASIGWAKQRRIVFAAQHFLLRLPSPPPCRFDVVAIDGDRVRWLRAAFDAQ